MRLLFGMKARSTEQELEHLPRALSYPPPPHFFFFFSKSNVQYRMYSIRNYMYMYIAINICATLDE